MAEEASTEEISVEEQETLARLRDQYGDVSYWHVPKFGMVVAACPPNPKEYDRFVNAIRPRLSADEDEDAASAVETFAMACVVHPDRDAVKKLFRRYPAFKGVVSRAGQKLAGSGIKELGKG